MPQSEQQSHQNNKNFLHSKNKKPMYNLVTLFWMALKPSFRCQFTSNFSKFKQLHQKTSKDFIINANIQIRSKTSESAEISYKFKIKTGNINNVAHAQSTNVFQNRKTLYVINCSSRAAKSQQ